MPDIDFDFKRYIAQRQGEGDARLRAGAAYAYPGDQKVLRTLSRITPVNLATAATVQSGTYETEVRKLGPHTVVSRAAGLLAPIVEEGWEDSELARAALQRYLAALPDIDTLLLGCTHYPLLEAALADVVPDGVTVLDPAPFVAERLADWLRRHPTFDPVEPEPVHRVLCTGDPQRFATHGARFLGHPLPPVEPIAEQGGRLAPRDPGPIPTGQIVR